jgi:hypothetical protein
MFSGNNICVHAAPDLLDRRDDLHIVPVGTVNNEGINAVLVQKFGPGGIERPDRCATRRLPFASRVAFGYWRFSRMSCIVIIPINFPFLSTTGSARPCRVHNLESLSASMSSGAVIGFFVMIFVIFHRRASIRSPARHGGSRLPMIFPLPTTGSPPMLYWCHQAFGIGNRCAVFDKHVHRARWFLCLLDIDDFRSSRSGVILRWITPIPPSRARAIAIVASVTVSMCSRDKRDIHTDIF